MDLIPIRILRLSFLVMLITLGGCRQQSETIRQGRLLYNVNEIFVGKPHGLELAKAAGRGDVDRVSELIRLGFDVNELGKEQITPLWWTAWANNIKGFRSLLEHGANPNIPKTSGLSPMHLIAEMEDVRFLDAALKHKGDPNIVDPLHGSSPIWIAVNYGLREHTKLLLDAGADPKFTNSISGMSLPDLALGANDGYELAVLLLKRGADPKHRDIHGNTIMTGVMSRTRNRTDGASPFRAELIEILRTNGVYAEK